MQVICPLKVDTLADVQHTVVVEDLGVPETHLHLALERWLATVSLYTWYKYLCSQKQEDIRPRLRQAAVIKAALMPTAP